MAAQSAQFMTDLARNMTPDTVDIRTTSTANSYGELTFSGAVTTYNAYVRRSTKAERGGSNDQAVVEWIVYIPDSSLVLAVGDELTLPAPVSAVRPIVRVDIVKTVAGQAAVTVWVGPKSSRG
jgi:hypothetical protein